MTVTPFVTATPTKDEISPIPHPLGFSSEPIPDPTMPPGFDADVTVAGLHFLMSASDDDPYQRQLQKVQKQQIDQSEKPGDNSLQDWWTRTQTDWSGGAGQDYMEPISTDGVSRRFKASAGVDPFTHPGQVSQLPLGTSFGTPLDPGGEIVMFAGGFAVSGGNEVRIYDDAPSPNLIATQTAGGDVKHLAVAAGFVMISLVGKVQTMPTSGATAPIDRYVNAGTNIPAVGYLKNRTLVGAGDKAWEVPGNPDVPLDMATATPIVNMNDPSWEWVAAASTPVSILLAGNGGGTGSILSLTIDPQSGNLPTLAAPTVVAEFPPSERLTAMATYLGTYVIIATTAGVRAGEISGAGGITYGPLLGSPACTGGFTMWDRFAQYPTADAGDGRGGLVRVDLSEVDKDGRAAWATFVRIADTTPVKDHVMLDGMSAVMLDTDGGLWHTDPSGPRDSGWLDTSQVRYGTLEGKNFQSVRVMAVPPVVGVLDTYSLIDGIVGDLIGSMTSTTGAEASYPTGNRRALTSMGLHFEFTGQDEVGPILEAWSMRSLPAVTDRGEQVLLPSLCFDFERASAGVNGGYEGRAWERWTRLAEAISGGANITVTELRTGHTYVAIAEDCSFKQVAPPTMASGFGGIISLLLREAK